MEEGDLNIVEIILDNMPLDTEVQERIKMYMQFHIGDCNHFLYRKYSKETTLLNCIFKALRAELGREILKVLSEKKML